MPAVSAAAQSQPAESSSVAPTPSVPSTIAGVTPTAVPAVGAHAVATIGATVVTCPDPATADGSESGATHLLAAGVVVDAVVRCETVTHVRPATARSRCRSPKLPTPVWPTSLTELRRPSDARGTNVVCPMLRIATPWFALIDNHGDRAPGRPAQRPSVARVGPPSLRGAERPAVPGGCCRPDRASAIGRLSPAAPPRHPAGRRAPGAGRRTALGSLQTHPRESAGSIAVTAVTQLTTRQTRCWAGEAPTTPRGTCWCSRGSRRSASAPACTSGRPTAAGSCTACGRSSTTPSTRRLAGHWHAIEVVAARRRLRRGARRRPRHPGRHRAEDGAVRRRGRDDQAARRRQVRRRLVRRLRRPARRRRLAWSTRCRSRLDVEVDRDGATHAMCFRRGEPGVFAGDGADAKFTETVGAAQGQADRARRSPAPASGSGPTGRSSPRTPRSTSTS